jgi:hypothetical protein
LHVDESVNEVNDKFFTFSARWIKASSGAELRGGDDDDEAEEVFLCVHSIDLS